MNMRSKLVIANRKMNGSLESNERFLRDLIVGTQHLQKASYTVCMPHPYLFQAQAILKNSAITWGGQNMSRYDHGPFTGSVSPAMLKDFGCKYVIIGHSERRLRGHDTDESTGERFKVAVDAGITPIFCMGETLAEYNAGITDEVTIRQLNAVISVVGITGLLKGVLAYEPVWAIGTGKAATPQHAQGILSFLRGHIGLLNQEVADKVHILYGGSVSPNNASDLFCLPDVDGGLIGNACLNIESFVRVCEVANQYACDRMTSPHF
ncbi:MAG TPA: triose-phosphate isomerase [Methylophilaceae bacterium]|nr:triose-phosphate isomerase [Methylophilaceae bacterium]HAJ72107.1 triose-phosphate isomerase [Methylophilaceae bacterium]